MASTTSSNVQTGPIVYKLTDQNTDTIYIATNSDFTQLNIITNSSAALLVDLDWWAEATIPLSIDGNAHTFVLDSSTNPDYHAYGSAFKDGTLYYSAFQNGGQNYIAVWLVPESNQTVSQDGNGIYALSQIVVSDLQSAANSFQNNAGSLVGAVISAIGGGIAGAKGGIGGIIVGALSSGLPALLTANATAQQQLTGIAPSTASQVQTIAQQGYNAYYAAYQAAQQKLQAQQQAQNSKYNANASPSATSNGLDMNTTIVLGAILGIGVLGVLALYLMKK